MDGVVYGGGLFNHVVKLGICTLIPAINGEAGPHLEPVSTEWHRSRMSLQTPFGWNMQEIRVDGKKVDEGRNEAVKLALEYNFDYLFFLDYDVLVTPLTLHRLMYTMLNHPEIDVVTGVYCAKSNPASPLIYKGWGTGVFWDWKVGDFLIDGITGGSIGCGLIKTSLFKRLSSTAEKPWFKTVYEFNEALQANVKITEDIWFFRRITTELEAKIGVDTGVLCGHIDAKSGVVYSLPVDSLPMRRIRND